jgi:hypothetical protein
VRPRAACGTSVLGRLQLVPALRQPVREGPQPRVERPNPVEITLAGEAGRVLGVELEVVANVGYGIALKRLLGCGVLGEFLDVDSVGEGAARAVVAQSVDAEVTAWGVLQGTPGVPGREGSGRRGRG